MRGKYITTNMIMACLSNAREQKKDIHTQLKESIAERKRIIREWKKLSQKQADLFIKIDKEAA